MFYHSERNGHTFYHRGTNDNTFDYVEIKNKNINMLKWEEI